MDKLTFPIPCDIPGCAGIVGYTDHEVTGGYGYCENHSDEEIRQWQIDTGRLVEVEP